MYDHQVLAIVMPIMYYPIHRDIHPEHQRPHVHLNARSRAGQRNRIAFVTRIHSCLSAFRTTVSSPSNNKNDTVSGIHSPHNVHLDP